MSFFNFHIGNAQRTPTSYIPRSNSEELKSFKAKFKFEQYLPAGDSNIIDRAT